MSAATSRGPLAIIDRELTFMRQRLDKVKRKADRYAEKIGSRSEAADALVERTQQRLLDLRQARLEVLQLMDVAAKTPREQWVPGKSAAHLTPKMVEMVEIAKSAGQPMVEFIELRADGSGMVDLKPGLEVPRWILSAARDIEVFMNLHHPGPWALGGIQRRESTPKLPGMTIDGLMLVPIEPVTGNRYAAGDWSRRNWEAALEDQRGVGYPTISGESGGRST